MRKPIAILQHAPDVGPGYFATWCEAQRQPTRLIRLDRGEPVPVDARAFAGICSMGGPMSANDRLPWVDAECDLLRQADAAGVPVIGHCLGGQLLARALGAQVRRNAVIEIGWGSVRVTDHEVSERWLGPGQRFEVFQWHSDTFEVPDGARNFLASAHCPRQAFVVERGRCAHLGMQFHCEMTPELVRAWVSSVDGRAELAEAIRRTDCPAVQDADSMLEALETRTARMNALAAQLYARWAQGLAD